MKAPLLRLAVKSAHLFVIFALLLGSFFGPNYSDDQWIVEIARELAEIGGGNNQYPGASSWGSMGTVHIFLIWLLDSTGIGFIGLRIAVSLFFIFPSWLLLTGAMRNLSGKSLTNQRLWASALFFAFFSYSWLITIRPEPFIVLALSSGLFFWSKALISESQVFSSLALASAAIAASTHPAGLVALALALGVVVLTFRNWRAGKMKLPEVVFTVFWPTTLFLLLMFWLNDLGSLSSAVNGISMLETHSYTPFDEWRRWERVLGESAPRAASALLGLGVWVTAVAVLVFTKRRVFWAVPFVFLPLGLLLTPSKWEWHVGVLLPAVVWAIDQTILNWRENRSVFTFSVAPALVIACLPLANALRGWGLPVPGLALTFFAVFALAAFLVVTQKLYVRPWIAFLLVGGLAAPQFFWSAPDWNSSPCQNLDAVRLYVPNSPILSFGEKSPGTENVNLDFAVLRSAPGYTALWFRPIDGEGVRLRSDRGEFVYPLSVSADPYADSPAQENLKLWQLAIWDLSGFDEQDWAITSSSALTPLAGEALLGYGSVEPISASVALQNRSVSFGMYEATRYHCLDGLNSDRGLVQWPDFLISDRALYSFTRAFHGMDAVALSLDSSHYGVFYAVVGPERANVTIEMQRRH